MKALAVAVVVSLLGGCAAQPTPRSGQAGADRKLTNAVVAPLADLNLVREPIPSVLAAAQKAPYGAPADLSCAALGAEIELLDAALGDDLDTARDPASTTLAERGAEEAGDAVISAVRSTTEGVIPFRGWVRKLSGADRYAKEVAAAIGAGTVRRAYLKGLGEAGACAHPAAPKRPAPAEAAVQAAPAAATEH